MSNENIDTRTDAEKAPLKTNIVEPKPTAKVKTKPEPKPAWEPSLQVTAALAAIELVDAFDKKGIAAIVKGAIDLRTTSKAVRERTEVAKGDNS